MPCEHYKDSLIEVAASGAAPKSELRAHLSGCAPCRMAFDEERSLFAAIDSGLHAAVNTEVPPSLLPCVRTLLDEAALTRPRLSPAWFALVGAAVSAVILLSTFIIRNNEPRTSPVDSAAVRPTVEQINPIKRTPLSSKASETGISIPRLQVFDRDSASLKEPTSNNAMPEVLVPRDQEVLLASYAQEWGSRKRAPLVAADADQTIAALLEIAPIQIPELDVKLLTEVDRK